MNLPANCITSGLLAETCGRSTYQRGKGYAHRGRTFGIQVENHTPLDLHFTAVTQGSGNNQYRQDILLTYPEPGSPPELDGQCSCPVGYNCKHVVSACLTYRTHADHYAMQGNFADWLSAQFGVQHDQAAATQANERLHYRLAFGPESGQATVELRLSRRKRNGGWGRGTPISLLAVGSPYNATRNALTELDREILDQLRVANPYLGSGPATLRGRQGGLALTWMLQTGRLYWHKEPDNPITEGRTRQLALTWRAHRDQYWLLPTLEEGEAHLLLLSPPRYLDTGALTMGPVALPEGIDETRLRQLENAPGVPAEEADAVSRRLALEFPELPTPTAVRIEEVTGVSPTPVLLVHGNAVDPAATRFALRFGYGDILITPSTDEPTATGEADGPEGAMLVRVHRDQAAEAHARGRLAALGLHPLDYPATEYTATPPEATGQSSLQQALELLDNGLPQLQSEGWDVIQMSDERLQLSSAAGVEARVDEAEKWFDLQFDLELDGQRIPLLPLVTQLLEAYEPDELPPELWLPVAEGHFARIPRAQIAPVLETLLEVHQGQAVNQNLFEDGEALRFSRLDAPRLLDLGDIPVRGSEAVRALADKLAHFERLTPAPPPADFHGTLRPYQQEGVNWLQFLREYGLGGILADDMGLGKTVQTLAHLAIEKAARRLTHPSLVVAPTSLLSNWRREAAQFTPGLRVLVLQGADRKQYFDRLSDYDLILTTYPLLPRDGAVLNEQRYSYLILDEAQQIKNPRAQAAQWVRALEADHRLCLTGTPMENHLGELWAQFDFLLPGFLGDREQFTRQYRTPIEKHRDTDRLRQLTRRTAPFLLRRTKDVVARELPEKSELLRSTPIGGKQATLYESIRLTMEKKVREAIARKGLARSQITILDALLKLRQVCCDPRLLPVSAGKGQDVPSAKLRMLMEMVPELLEEGRRILIFSQFTKMLGLIEQELRPLGIPYSKLTGQTRKRDAAIEAFRRGEANLFLVSLKAGGVGLNLTEADTVIHYDPWWNPAVEAQATDRAHRIGQDKPVFVYKLITENTVEEKILAMQTRKQRLADNLYQGGQRDSDQPAIDAEMIRDLLSAP